MEPASATWQLDEHSVPLTHLDRLYWPEAGFTKGDMLRYYRDIAPALLPHLHERPVTLRVYPGGTGGPGGAAHYQRDLSPRAPSWFRREHYQPKSTQDTIHLVLVNDLPSLIWLANSGAVEFHLWVSRLPDLNMPDMAVFDLDPGEQVSFTEVLEAASHLRDMLGRQSISAYAKTSGGAGLHVFVPLAPGNAFDDVRAWVKLVAEALTAAHPALVAVASGPTHRGERVTVDYAQNGLGRNTAAPYTLRAYSSSPVVSTPLTWSEIEAGRVRPTDFTPEVVLERVKRMGDIFAPVLRADQRIHV